MKKEEILKKAIEKAEQNGFEMENCTYWYICDKCDDNRIHFYRNDINPYGDEKKYSWDRSIEQILFNHDFAKAFFTHRLGSKYTRIDTGDKVHTMKPKRDKNVWQYHLQKLALSEDRLKYIEQFI